MIRCSHCGKLAPKGAMSCQHCGMPLVSGGNGAAGVGESEQQELPAWLESLRAHERPVSGTQENRQPFSLDELVGEDSMPSWMRQDRQKEPRNGNSDSLPIIPTVQGAPGQEKQGLPSAGFQAGSLIDERSLPAWMREGQTGGQPAAGQSVQAHSLVDQQSLPAWMKDLSQATPAIPAQIQIQTPTGNQPYNPPPVTPPAVRVPQTPPEPPPSLEPGFSAHDLLDVQALPSWMSGSQNPGTGAPPVRPVPTGQGFNAGELVDAQAMPPWLRDIQGQGKSDPQSAMGVPVNGLGQTAGTGQGQQGILNDVGRPANPLTENTSIPPWLREIQPESAPGLPPTPQSFNAGSLLDASSAPAWMREGAPGAAPAPQSPAPQNAQGFGAGSLLDMNSMPSWMREGAQATPGLPVTPQAPAPQNAQGFGAGSLLDASSAPAWMREGAQGLPATPSAAPQASLQPEQGFSAGSLLDMNSMPSWMREGAPGQGQMAQNSAQGMSAGSLIDPNAMPAWLRNSDNQQQNTAGGRPGQAPVRPVPSRPRGESAPQDQSEVAANVFSAMLGVAASTPALPGQEAVPPTGNLAGTLPPGISPSPALPPMQNPQLYQQQAAPQPQSPVMPGWQQAGQNQYNQGGLPHNWQSPSMSQPSAPQPPGGRPGSVSGRLGGMAPAEPPPPWNGPSAAERTALGVTSGAPTGAEQNRPGNAETKKKGFFDSIRDFFSK